MARCGMALWSMIPNAGVTYLNIYRFRCTATSHWSRTQASLSEPAHGPTSPSHRRYRYVHPLFWCFFESKPLQTVLRTCVPSGTHQRGRTTMQHHLLLFVSTSLLRFDHALTSNRCLQKMRFSFINERHRATSCQASHVPCQPAITCRRSAVTAATSRHSQPRHHLANKTKQTASEIADMSCWKTRPLRTLRAEEHHR
jgi:hypothetical protein